MATPTFSLSGEGEAISAGQLAALGERLDSLGDQLDEREKVVLMLAFSLAGSGIREQHYPDAEVEGFGEAPNFSIHVPGMTTAQPGPPLNEALGRAFFDGAE